MDKFEKILNNIIDSCEHQGKGSCTSQCPYSNICTFLFGDEMPQEFKANN